MSDTRVQMAKGKVRDTDGVAEAISRVLAGDVNAYSVLHEASDARLRAFVGRRYARLGDDFVEEVVVRAHTRAFERLGEYDRKRSGFVTWLCWQARAVAREVQRERFDRRAVQLDASIEVVYTQPASDPAQEHERAERNRVLREELRSLSEQGRVSIACHDLGGWTFSATAQKLGATVPQVRRWREKGLAELRRRVMRRGVRPVESVPVYGRVVGSSEPQDGEPGADVTADR